MKLTLNLKNYQSYILTGLIIFGPIKSIFNGLILNVDLTLIILGIAFFDFLINIRKLSVKKHSFFFLLLLFGIWLLMLFSIPYSSSSIISYDKFFKFKDICEKEGINVPIIPGLKPISTKKQLNILLCNLFLHTESMN